MQSDGVGRLAAFGLSGFAQNVIGTCLGVHLFMFYTDVVGLEALWVSLGLTVATLWDAVSDVWMGRISDRTRWRAGRRRPYLLLGAVPVGLSFWLLFSPPAQLHGAALGIYFCVVLLALFTAQTVVQVPALSLLPEMAKTPHERTRLAAAREMLGNFGDLAGLLLPIVLLLALGADTEEGASEAGHAFQIAAAIGGAAAILAVLVCYRGTREDQRVVPAEKPLFDSLRELRANRAFMTLLVASSLAALGLAFVQSLILYVLTHVMGESDPAVHLGAFVVNVLGAVLSYPFWTWLARTRGKPFAFRVGLALSSVTFVTVFFVTPGQLWLLLLVMAFSGAANVGFWMLLYALSADVVDVDELEHGQRREGLFAGFAALVRKCAFAAAAAGVGVGLTLIGYREGAAQDADTILGLRALFAVPPTVLVLAALFVFRRFGLTREVHEGVQAQLARRARPQAGPEADPAMAAPAPAVAQRLLAT
ncbi:MAG: MFS transporter [Sandaracinaceae bacterium]